MGPSGFTTLEQKLKIGRSTREQQFRMITLVLNSSFHLETHDFTWGAQTSWLPALSLHSLPLILFLPYGQAVLRGSLALLWSCVKWWIEGPVPQSIVSGMPVSWKQRPSLQLELRASMATAHDKSFGSLSSQCPSYNTAHRAIWPSCITWREGGLRELEQKWCSSVYCCCWEHEPTPYCWPRRPQSPIHMGG